jgi:mono/diheme cytochrome c family protein
MKTPTITAGLVAAVFLSATSVALAQAKPQARVDFGELEYKSSCAACHGPKGKGDGPYMKWLIKPATDLTTLAKANKGVFPLQRVYEIIDGRGSTDIGPHGSREMPIWGARYSAEAIGYFAYAEVPGPFDSEALVRARILALAEYLNRLQVK